MVTTRMLMRSPRRTAPVVAAAAIVVLALPLAWYLASPLFLTQAVSESAPAAASDSAVRFRAAGPRPLAGTCAGVLARRGHLAHRGRAKLG